ncbi:hypothetical protein BDF21DRAFT_421314 [Thamnidium elegans]|uniref:Uncharacterized protein n=1 Tax=Thamnidium elegans TaxID=101142 RepID=A0A8H7SVE7_9FUNG|nr:hypothetical protein INT48_002452 [Thamnidium elegans]KAI8077572.1 hypothetical protein BDF21DRAFT_421314 [Thamnidium elegans]
MQSASEYCSHIEPEDLTGCPFECKTWLNSFPWDAANARFEHPSFRNFLELIENIPEVKCLFKSFELTFDKKLFDITDKAKDSKDSTWKVNLAEKLESVKSLPTLNPKELLLFKQLMANKVLQHIRGTKHGVVPNILLITSNDNDNTKNAKIIYNELNRKTQPFTFEDLALIHKVMPLLETLSIDYLNIISAGDEKVVVNANELKSISVKCANRVDSPVGLIIFLLQTYHWSIKSFKLEMDEGKIKQEDMFDDGDHISNAFEEIAFQFDNLESFELNYFYKSINIAMLLNRLGSTKCKLKHICLLGQPDSKNVFYYMIKDHANTLQSLTVSTHRYHSVNLLSLMKVLEKFSYRWDSLDENVDVFKVLTIMPKLKYLELGHNRIQGNWVDKIPGKKVFENLTTLSLYNVQIKEHTFKSLFERLPNLKNVILTNCRIGVSSNSSESIIKFGNYVLDSLVLDNCKLCYPKRDVKPKGRSISRFKLSMDYHEPYATTIKYNNDETSESKLYIDNEYFVYDIAPVEPFCSITNTLFIKANLIRSFSASRNATENVTFCPESEIEIKKNEDIDLSPEHGIIAIDGDSDVEKEISRVNKKSIKTVTEVEVITEAEVDQKLELDNTIKEINEVINMLDDDNDILDYLDKEVESVQNTIVDHKEEATVRDITTDDKEQNNAVVDKKEVETEEEEGVFVVSGSDDDEEIEDASQEKQPNTINLDEETDKFKKYRVPATLFSSDDDESLPSASLPGTPSKPIDQEDVDSENGSDHDRNLVNDSDDDSEYASNSDIENNLSEKLIYSTDEDYLSDDSETPIRKSLRKRPIRTRGSNVSKRKRARVVSSSEEEDYDKEDNEDDNEDDNDNDEPCRKYRKLVSDFVENCKKYNAVIRLSPNASAKK